jgi:hypothetical protein
MQRVVVAAGEALDLLAAPLVLLALSCLNTEVTDASTYFYY